MDLTKEISVSYIVFTLHDLDKNINSEPKKKTLQVFASLHETDEN